MFPRDQLFCDKGKLRCNESSFVGHMKQTIYSSLPNKRTGPKKRTGWNFEKNQISVQYGILIKIRDLPEYLTKIQKIDKLAVPARIRAYRVEVWSKSNKAYMYAYSGD